VTLFSRTNPIAGERSNLKEDMLLVTVANDRGWQSQQAQPEEAPAGCKRRRLTSTNSTSIYGIQEWASPVDVPQDASVRLKRPKAFNKADLPSSYQNPERPPAQPGQHAEKNSINRRALQDTYPAMPTAYNDARQIYTDGSCLSDASGKTTGVGAGVYIPSTGERITVDPCGKGPTNTIMRAELSAIHAALEHSAGPDNVMIITDSEAALDGIRNMMQRPSHMCAHLHRDLLKDIVALLKSRSSQGRHTTMARVKAHSGVAGNEEADKIAKRAASTTQRDRMVSVGNDPFADRYWAHTFEYTDSNKKSEAMHGQRPWADQLSQAERRAQLASNPPGITRRALADLEPRALAPYCHRRKRMGSSNLHTLWVSAWRKANAQLDTALSNQAIWHPSTPHKVRVRAIKLSWGLEWNRALATLFRVSYLGGPGAPSERSAVCSLCGKDRDGCSHMLSGCKHRKMKGMYINRHNTATKMLMRARERGAQGNCFVIMDAGNAGEAEDDDKAEDTVDVDTAADDNSAEEMEVDHTAEKADDAPLFSAGNRLTDLLLPDLDPKLRNKLRPDGLCIPTLRRDADFPSTRAERAMHEIDLIEVGYGSDTRLEDKIQSKAKQHTELQGYLLAAGWKRVRVHIFPLGTICAMHKSSVPTLVALGVEPAQARKVLAAVARASLAKAQEIVVQKRIMEAELQQRGGGSTQGYQRRSGVG